MRNLVLPAILFTGFAITTPVDIFAQSNSTGGSLGKANKSISGAVKKPAKRKNNPKRQVKKSKSPKSLGLSASWLGMSSDRVGRGSQATPNGQLDGSFRLVVNTGGVQRVINHISLKTAPFDSWDTTPNMQWILGVERNGRRLNPSDNSISDVVNNQAIYKVFANDAGSFKPQKSFTFEVRFSDGSKLTTNVRIQ